MSGDSFFAANQHAEEAPGAIGRLFDASEDLGEGCGANERRKAEDSKLMAILGAKLRKARKAARLSESAAGLALAHEGVTQISLYENGHRFPSFTNLRLLAKLYGVTIDYLLDMHDDILLAPEEGNQAVMQGIVSATLSQQFSQFVEVISRRNSLVLEGLSIDRRLLGETAKLSVELVDALKVVQRRAPNFDEIPGGAKLTRLIGEFNESMAFHTKRQRFEEAEAAHETFNVTPEQIVKRVEQLMIEL
ncbi:helix-turn-helix domain-containing protein [Pseudomonas lurida]|nr:helix-turn-helix transcriptional regulator [Pseudomonas lurida]MBD8671593.1 helix-turn-helix transcriptional regulator [Pseudomonas lurida]